MASRYIEGILERVRNGGPAMTDAEAHAAGVHVRLDAMERHFQEVTACDPPGDRWACIECDGTYECRPRIWGQTFLCPDCAPWFHEED